MIALAHQRGQGDLYLDRMLFLVIADRKVQALQQRAQPPGGQRAQVVAVQRQPGQQLTHDGGVGRRRGRLAVELGQRRLALGEVAAELADALGDRRSRLRGGLLVLQRQDLPAEPRLEVGGLALQLGRAGAAGSGASVAVSARSQ